MCGKGPAEVYTADQCGVREAEEKLGGIVEGNISATSVNNAFLLKPEEFLQSLKGNKMFISSQTLRISPKFERQQNVGFESL